MIHLCNLIGEDQEHLADFFINNEKQQRYLLFIDAKLQH